MTESLPAAARAVVEEEEALLASVRRALAKPRAPRRREPLAAELVALRDEASGAHERDLPALLQGLRVAQALALRERPRPLPHPDSPYFAHLAIRVGGERRDYLLGRGTFADRAAGIRVVDWRVSPIAQVFYQYQEGDEVEEPLPGGLLRGLVEARRVLVVERGVLTRIVAGAFSLAKRGGSWRAEGPGAFAAGGAGTAVRPGILGTGAGATDAASRPEITALLDPAQHEAVTADPRRPLLVLGSAGSGKTTVALHRLARIGAQRGHQGRLGVVVPEEGLARLSRRLLEPLGMASVRVETLEAWLKRSAGAAFGPKALRLSPETPALVSALKRHPALRRPLLERLRPPLPAGLAPLRSRLADVFTDRRFLGGVVEAAGGGLPRTAVEETVRHTMLQLATPLARELAGIDPERLATLDGRSIEEGTPDELAGTLDLEDLALLLFLRAQGGARPGETLVHLVLDEAEDLSLFELFALGKLLARDGGVTVAGDEAQQTQSSFAGWPAGLEALGVRDAAVCRLAVSYRCPRPVVELAQRLLGGQVPAEATRAAREGAPVGHHHFPDEPQAHLFLAGALHDLADREPRASVAVVAATPASAEAIHRALRALPSARLVLDGRFGFEPGVDVTDVDGAKGLEWDYVVIPDATASAYPATDEARRRLHVAVTRASHQLWIVSSGRRSPLVEGAGSGNQVVDGCRCAEGDD